MYQAYRLNAQNKNRPMGGFCFYGAVNRTRTGNLSRARSHYFHSGVDYIFTMNFRL